MLFLVGRSSGFSVFKIAVSARSYEVNISQKFSKMVVRV